MLKRSSTLQRSIHLLSKPRFRLSLALLLTFGTIGLFCYYLASHNSLLVQLLATPPITIALLLLLFALWFCSMGFILWACLYLCNKTIPSRMNLLINAYSTFLNYFLPGQGGPMLRGLYLKGKYKLPLGQYVLATLIYYIFYAAVSMLLLIGGVRAWWQTLIGIITTSLLAYIGTRFYAKRHRISGRSLNFNSKSLTYLFIATCIQAIFQFLIYWVELTSIAPVNVGQVMSYTGAANFSLFASITPGAVGIRESFLVFSQSLHHTTNDIIVAANALDRSTYIVFLMFIFAALLLLRGKAIFSFKREVTEKAKEVTLGQPEDGLEASGTS